MSPEVVALIVQTAREYPLWRRRRIETELAHLGHHVGKDAVATYMPRPAERTPRPPSHTCGTFIRNHAVGTIAIDLFTVPTVTFDVLYAFFVLSLERRRVIHVNVTEHPTAEWAAQQIVEAVGPDEGVPRLIRDRKRAIRNPGNCSKSSSGRFAALTICSLAVPIPPNVTSGIPFAKRATSPR